MKLFTSHKPKLEDCPPRLTQNLLSWKSLNPSFEFEYYSDDQMVDWMKQNASPKSVECFDSLNTGAGKADFYRIRKLFVEGGVWFDADLPPNDILARFPDFMEKIKNFKTVFFVTKKTNEPRFMIMASLPGNPLFEEFENRTCQKIIKYKESGDFIPTINLTGPKAFHRCLCQYLNIEKISDIKIGSSFTKGEVSFAFMDDIVEYTPEGGAKIMYKGYRKELERMGVTHHKFEHALGIDK